MSEFTPNPAMDLVLERDIPAAPTVCGRRGPNRS